MKIIYKLFVGAVTAVKALNFNFYNKKEIATPLAQGGSHIRRYTISDCSSHIVSSSGSYRKRNIRSLLAVIFVLIFSATSHIYTKEGDTYAIRRISYLSPEIPK